MRPRFYFMRSTAAIALRLTTHTGDLAIYGRQMRGKGSLVRRARTLIEGKEQRRCRVGRHKALRLVAVPVTGPKEKDPASNSESGRLSGSQNLPWRSKSGSFAAT